MANLFLVRIDARRREVALRAALGARRAQLASTYLTESMLLAVASGVLAVALAGALLRVLTALAPAELPRLAEVHLSSTGIAFALGFAALAGLVLVCCPR